MKLILEIPDELSAELSSKFANPTRAALEALAAAAYSQNVLSLEQVRRLLGLESSWAAQEILSKHGSWPSMSVEDFREDMAGMKTLRAGV